MSIEEKYFEQYRNGRLGYKFFLMYRCGDDHGEYQAWISGWNNRLESFRWKKTGLLDRWNEFSKYLIVGGVAVGFITFKESPQWWAIVLMILFVLGFSIYRGFYYEDKRGIPKGLNKVTPGSPPPLAT